MGYYVSPTNHTGNKFDISHINLVDIFFDENIVVLDSCYNGMDLYEIYIVFLEGPTPKDFAGTEVSLNIYTSDTFPYEEDKLKVPFTFYPSHFNYQGTDVSENDNDTSWCELLKINDIESQPITAHHLLQYQPIDDNPETSYIYLSYTHRYNDTPHRFYISNALYNYWTTSDYSKNLQIFSSQIYQKWLGKRKYE